jgi:hypothetical protein
MKSLDARLVVDLCRTIGLPDAWKVDFTEDHSTGEGTEAVQLQIEATNISLARNFLRLVPCASIATAHEESSCDAFSSILFIEYKFSANLNHIY